ncbi:MAG: DegT/DnrJ/EryC1/StrS family aminotransferase [Pseudonocardiales bacterium]|nr:MAG: DegT/DnrJ/EryC1/StrS family aminotransferase [Pseudonocardiales bacterium]
MTIALPAVLGGAPAFAEPLPLVRPTISDIPGLARRLEQILGSGMLTNGRVVRELEDAVAQRCDVEHVVAVANCTSGLMLTLLALGAAGRVVVPSFTFAASAHAIVWAGGEPSFAEVDRMTLTLDTGDAASLADEANAITATHVHGAPCDVDGLTAVAESAGIPLVFDAAHALGSMRAGRPVGGFGTAEVFSMSPTKVAVAGEGGLVTTNNAELAHAIRLGRDYGNPGNYDCQFPGLSARMSELHAAVGLASLAGLDERIVHRNDLVTTFKDRAAGVPGMTYQQVRKEDVSTFKDLTLIIDPESFGLCANDLGRALAAEQIDSRRYYYPPVHRQQAYAHLPQHRKLPVTDEIADRVLTPPLYSHMTHAQIRAVADAVVAIHKHAPAVRDALG